MAIKKSETGFQAGDIFFLRGKGPVSILIRFLISVRYGIPFKETYSHVEFAKDETTHISAEPKGVEEVPAENDSIIKSKRVEAYRIKMISTQVKKVVNTGISFLGTKYAVARYLLDTLRLGMFFFSFVMIFSFITGKWNAWIILGIIILFIALEQILKYYDIRTMDCAEITSTAYNAAGIIPVLGKARDDHPSGIRKAVKTLEWNGRATLIAIRTDKSHGWEFEDKK